MRVLGRRFCSIYKGNTLWSTNIKLLIDDEIDKTYNKNISNEMTSKILDNHIEHIKKHKDNKDNKDINKLEDPIRDIY